MFSCDKILGLGLNYGSDAAQETSIDYLVVLRPSMDCRLGFPTAVIYFQLLL
jgi:hypothetical protein